MFEGTFDDWIKVSSLTFVREEDKEKDFIVLALWQTNTKINTELISCGFEKKNEEEKEKILLICKLFFPIIMNFFAIKYYYGFVPECNNQEDPLAELRTILGNDRLINSYPFFKPEERRCQGC